MLDRSDSELVSDSSVSLQRVVLVLALRRSSQGGAWRRPFHAGSTPLTGWLQRRLLRPWASVDFALRTAVIDRQNACLRTSIAASALVGPGCTTPGGSKPTRFPLACLGHLKRAKGRRGVGAQDSWLTALVPTAVD